MHMWKYKRHIQQKCTILTYLGVAPSGDPIGESSGVEVDGTSMNIEEWSEVEDAVIGDVLPRELMVAPNQACRRQPQDGAEEVNLLFCIKVSLCALVYSLV